MIEQITGSYLHSIAKITGIPSIYKRTNGVSK